MSLEDINQTDTNTNINTNTNTKDNIDFMKESQYADRENIYEMSEMPEMSREIDESRDDEMDEIKGETEDNTYMDEDEDEDTETVDGLDISWVQEHEILNNIDKMYCREPMKTIRAHFLYINKTNSLEKILTEPFELEVLTDAGSGSGSEGVDGDIEVGISKKTLEYFTQTKRNSHGKYKLSDILLYCVTLEPEQLQSFAMTDIDIESETMNLTGLNTDTDIHRFLKEIPLFSDKIIIPPSIFIFHEINSVYFIFREAEIGLKSILKNNGNKNRRTTNKSINSIFFKKGRKNNITRKVMFAPIEIESEESVRV